MLLQPIAKCALHLSVLVAQRPQVTIVNPAPSIVLVVEVGYNLRSMFSIHFSNQVTLQRKHIQVFAIHVLHYLMFSITLQWEGVSSVPQGPVQDAITP